LWLHSLSFFGGAIAERKVQTKQDLRNRLAAMFSATIEAHEKAGAEDNLERPPYLEAPS
jgi:hypothetical protein